MDILCTEGLVDSGVIDYVWSNGWRKATSEVLHIAQHSWPDFPGEVLPDRAVIACFCVHFPEVVERLRQHSNGKYIIISRDGDPPHKGGDLDCIHHIFAINVEHQSSRVTAMPMAFHAFHGAAEHLEKARATPRARTEKRVMVSYSLDHPGSVYHAGHERITAIEHFVGQPWATVGEHLLGWKTRTGPVWPAWSWPEYLVRLREHDYCVVPVGYGTERVAQWEAMLLGTIPICLKHPALLQFADMPIAFVDSWQDVTASWCDANLDIINRSTEKLKLSYWVERIKEKRAEIS